jgi:endonuclease-3
MAGPVMVKQEPAGSSRGGEADEVKETRHDKITAATTASSSGAPRVKGKGKAMPNIKKEAGVVATSRPRRTHEETSAAAASPAKKAKKEEDASTTINDDDKAALRDLLSKWTQPGTLLKITASEISPYPKQERPTPFEALYARDLLAALHGEPERDKLEENCSGQGTLLEKRARSVLDSLVRTILSQNTTDALSKRAFDNLKKHFPTYKQVLAAKPGEVEEVIKFAGLSEIKVGRIRAILTTVMKERPKECVGGEPSLEFLREMPTEEIKEYLGGFKGVGPKTIACVLLFTIGADDFAVDTHVWHIAKRLGWVPAAASREDTYKHLNNRIPDCVKYSLHVLLVLHGKKCVSCCKGRTQLTPDGPCPLGRVGKVRGELAGLVVAAAAAAAIEEGVVKKEEGGGGKKKGKGKAKTPAIKKEVV